MTASVLRCPRRVGFAGMAFVVSLTVVGWQAGSAYAQAGGQNTAQVSKAESLPATAASTSRDVVTPRETSHQRALTARPDGMVGHPLHAAEDRLSVARPVENRSLFRRAAAAFPAFCKHWGRMLRDREVNNLKHVAWHDKNGWKTGTYIAYGPIKTCNTKATDGVPIGELTYREHEYSLVGHTVEQARHSPPKLIGVTDTTEIFRWDKSQWVY